MRNLLNLVLTSRDSILDWHSTSVRMSAQRKTFSKWSTKTRRIFMKNSSTAKFSSALNTATTRPWSMTPASTTTVCIRTRHVSRKSVAIKNCFSWKPLFTSFWERNVRPVDRNVYFTQRTPKLLNGLRNMCKNRWKPGPHCVRAAKRCINEADQVFQKFDDGWTSGLRRLEWNDKESIPNVDEWTLGMLQLPCVVTRSPA